MRTSTLLVLVAVAALLVAEVSAKKIRTHKRKHSPYEEDEQNEELLASGPPGESPEHDVNAPEISDELEPPFQWSYEGDNGPEFWDTDPVNKECKVGTEQSPINIISHEATLNTEAPKFEFHYGGEDPEEGAIDPEAIHIEQDEYLPDSPERGAIINTGHYFLIHWAKDFDYFYVGDNAVEQPNREKYVVESIKFHSPSEHTVDGEHFDMEMQIVHREAATGEVLNLALMFHAKEGGHNHFLDRLQFNNLPQQAGDSTVIHKTNLYSGLPFDKSYFSYKGSETHPPCTQGVQWRIFEHPVSMSNEQLKNHQAVFASNFRPVQETGDRAVTMSAPLFISTHTVEEVSESGDSEKIVLHPDGSVDEEKVDIGSNEDNPCDGCSYTPNPEWRQDAIDHAIKRGPQMRFKSRRRKH